MKTAIVYISTHHGNTKKLVDAVAAAGDAVVIDGIKEKDIDLSGYDRIGFASGIAYGKFYPQMLRLIEEKLPQGREVFFLYTYGMKRDGYTSAAAEAVAKAGSRIIGEYGCLGYDTFGPLKVIGGIAKGHPDEGEIAGAVKFYRELG